MATDAKYNIKTASGWDEYNFPPAKHSSQSHSPISSKTFEHVWSTNQTTANAKSDASGTTNGSTNDRDYHIYLGKISKTPNGNYYDTWSIKLKITACCETNNSYRSEHIVELHGAGSTVSSFVFNTIYSSSYRSIYYIFLNRLTATGFGKDGLAHLFGISFYSTNSQNSNNSSYKRKIVVDVMDQDNCEVSFLDDWVSVRNYSPATDSTNFYGYISSTPAVTGMTNFNAVDNGLQETGDANNYYQLLAYFRPKAGGIGIKGYSLIGLLKDGTYASFTATNNQCTGTSNQNTVNTTDEFSLNTPVWAYLNNTLVSAGSNAAGDYTYKATHAADVRYLSNYYGTSASSNPTKAFNVNGNTYSNAYVKINPDFAKGTFKVESLVLNETDKNAAGKGYYIFIGRNYSTSWYQITVDAQNPIQYWDGTKWIDMSVMMIDDKIDAAITSVLSTAV